eukprot:m.19306 g.19306  ORF g.19306 m.19306 type:complete len:71 (+) comp12207_c0_seq3:68-280(+)
MALHDLLADKEAPMDFLEQLGEALATRRRNRRQSLLPPNLIHTSVIRYFGRPILPPAVSSRVFVYLIVVV